MEDMDLDLSDSSAGFLTDTTSERLVSILDSWIDAHHRRDIW